MVGWQARRVLWSSEPAIEVAAVVVVYIVVAVVSPRWHGPGKGRLAGRASWPCRHCSTRNVLAAATFRGWLCHAPRQDQSLSTGPSFPARKRPDPRGFVVSVPKRGSSSRRAEIVKWHVPASAARHACQRPDSRRGVRHAFAMRSHSRRRQDVTRPRLVPGPAAGATQRPWRGRVGTGSTKGGWRGIQLCPLRAWPVKSALSVTFTAFPAAPPSRPDPPPSRTHTVRVLCKHPERLGRGSARVPPPHLHALPSTPVPLGAFPSYHCAKFRNFKAAGGGAAVRTSGKDSGKVYIPACCTHHGRHSQMAYRDGVCPSNRIGSNLGHLLTADLVAAVRGARTSLKADDRVKSAGLVA